jgi:ferritin-like metal-binding protein YciE
MQTEGQIQRLQQVFSLLDEKAEGAPCEAIQGILAEGSKVAGGPALDAGLVAAGSGCRALRNRPLWRLVQLGGL